MKSTLSDFSSNFIAEEFDSIAEIFYKCIINEGLFLQNITQLLQLQGLPSAASSTARKRQKKSIVVFKKIE